MIDLPARVLVPGHAEGPILASDLGLSFMGGVDPATGVVIDTHHPWRGQSVAGRVLVLPGGRGSCSGSGTLFELLLNGHAPAALIVARDETILTFAAILAAELFDLGIPVVQVDPTDFAVVRTAPWATVSDGLVTVDDASGVPTRSSTTRPEPVELELELELSESDRRALAGDRGPAVQLAMRVIVQVARLEGAACLIDIERSHIDGCFYQGPASLAFVGRMVELGGRVEVATTMNAICVDRRRWRELGVPAALGEASQSMVDALVALGVAPTCTCAPYQLADPPRAGEQIGWAESNAVVYANSVLGARTMKYPDYLDLLIAVTGRAPAAGPHLDAGRRAGVLVEVDLPWQHAGELDDAFWATLGYHVGLVAPAEIPVVTGLATTAATPDQLRTFGAAFATSSAAPMFHLVGLTPEATSVAVVAGAERLPAVRVGPRQLRTTWHELNSATENATQLVALGNPHFSLAEYGELAAHCKGRHRSPDVEMIITASREVHEQARAAGYVAALEAFGARFLADTCWCFIDRPVIPEATRTITTSSAKHAHYGTAVVGCGFHLRGLADCVTAAVTGDAEIPDPAWLSS